MRDLGVYRWILHIYFDYVQIPEFFFRFSAVLIVMYFQFTSKIIYKTLTFWIHLG